MSNDTVMIRLQKDTYGRGFNLESGFSYMGVGVRGPLCCTGMKYNSTASFSHDTFVLSVHKLTACSIFLLGI